MVIPIRTKGVNLPPLERPPQQAPPEIWLFFDDEGKPTGFEYDNPETDNCRSEPPCGGCTMCMARQVIHYGGSVKEYYPWAAFHGPTLPTSSFYAPEAANKDRGFDL